MANLTKTSWPGGWNPSQDDVNGSSDALLRMDNLRQNEDGVLALVRGAQKLNASQFSDYISRIFSKIINSVEYIWVALNDNTTDVLRSGNNFTSSTSILTNGGAKTCFGDALGQVLICAGSKRKKDNGTTVKDLGIITPLVAPTITPQIPPYLYLDPPNGSGAYTPFVGHDFFISGLSAYIFTDPDSLLGGINLTFASVTDMLNIGAGPANDPATDSLHVVFQFDFNPFYKFRVQILLANPDGSFGSDYYWVELDVANDPQFIQNGSTNPHIKIPRSQFTRAGSDPLQDWTRTLGIYFSADALSDCRFGVGQTHWEGGNTGVLNGYYQWAQVDVNDNGTYQAKSPLSPASGIELIQNGYVTVTPNFTADPQVTHHWIYRRSVPSTVAVGAVQPGIPDLLDRWYRVAVTPVNTPVDDTISDNDAIENEDITTIVDEFLQSIQDTDDILGMEGLFNERMLYLTHDRILLSDRLNPDAVDTRFTIKAFGDPTEKNLFIKKITNNQLILATTKDLYEIVGTLLDLPDGTLDAAVYAIGEKYPPLSSDFAFVDGKLFYIAADGIRVTTGSNSTYLSPQLALLFQGEDRHGVPSVAIFSDNQADYPMGVGHGNLYVTLIMRDLTRRLLVYNFQTNTFRLQYTDPLAIWATQTDRLLFGYGNGGDNFIREFEKGTDIDGSSGQVVFFQTIYDANQQPRNRKDTFTLKVTLDTGGVDVDVYLGKDKGNFVKVATVNTTGETVCYIDLSSYTLGFRYAVQMQGTGLKTFYLYEVTLEYEARPEQVNFLRIPNSNAGTYARKRWTSYAFVIDTLGNDVTFTPFVDNVSGSTSTVNKATKLTNIHYFRSDTVGTDVGGTLQSPSGEPFEFYGLNNEETISEKLPTPVKYLVIPANDYGNPNRKRHTSYKFQINTLGANVKFTPRLDGTNYAPATFNTSEKRTVEYFFDTSIDVAGIDTGGVLETLADTEFEFYGTIKPQEVEVLPARLESFYIPNTDYGKPSRKRFTSFKFQINTNGVNVVFTPRVDGANYASATFNTTERKTVEYFFDVTLDITGIDIGGKIISTSPFEYYGSITPEQVEVLPPRLKSLYTPNTNFGVAARKRLRTIPIIIDTRGSDVTFTPVVDGVAGATTTLNSSRKQTLYHFFLTDVFATDLAGIFTGTSPFEFYEFGQPEGVEVLPVPKKFDQLGPMRFDKIGKMFAFRLRVIPIDSILDYAVYSEQETSFPAYPGTPLYSGTISVVPDTDDIYEVKFPKSINADMVRIVLGPTTNIFHRYDLVVLVSMSGNESDSTWMPVK